MPLSYRNTTANNLSSSSAYVYYAFFPRFCLISNYLPYGFFHCIGNLCARLSPKESKTFSISCTSGVPETSKHFRSDHLPYPAVHIYDKHLENIPLRYMHLPILFIYKVKDQRKNHTIDRCMKCDLNTIHQKVRYYLLDLCCTSVLKFCRPIESR